MSYIGVRLKRNLHVIMHQKGSIDLTDTSVNDLIPDDDAAKASTCCIAERGDWRSGEERVRYNGPAQRRVPTAQLRICSDREAERSSSLVAQACFQIAI